MALPSLEKAWQFNVNQQTLVTDATSHLDTCQKHWFKVLQSMLGFASSPWTVVGSSNSTTAGMDGVNRIAASTNIIWSTSAAHSWIVLKQTGIAANFQICIEFSTPTGSFQERYIRIVVSPSAGFTGGTTTARPTATDEYNFFNGAQAIITATNGTDPLPLVLHAMQTTDGTSTRLVFCYKTIPSTYIAFEKPADTVTGWTVPYAATTSFNTGGVLGYATFQDASNVHSSQAGTFTMYMTGEGFANNSIGEIFNTVPNELSLEWPMLPVGLASNTTGKRGRHGRLVDIWWGSTFHVDGTCYPADGTRQFVQFGNLIFPWNGTAPVLT